MKKILLLSVLSLLVISACKKKEQNPSIVVTASFPVITLKQKYYSIAVGGVRPTVEATAVDTFYKQQCKVITIDSSVNNFVPGIYKAMVSAQNQYGFTSYATYYVAVTNVTSATDISGHYIQNPANDSISTDIVKLATGFYSTSNENGVNIYTDSADVTMGLFAVTSNSAIIFSDGTTGTLGLIPIAGDTTISYTTPLGVPVVFSH